MNDLYNKYKKVTFIYVALVLIKIELEYFHNSYPIIKFVFLKNNKYNFALLKRIFYIFLFISGFHFSGASQVKSTFVSDNEVKTVKFYPNPAISLINFEFQKGYGKSYNLLIFNFIGKKVIDLKPTAEKITVPLTDFYRGVYIFQLLDAKGNIVESGKFQVVK